MLKHETTNATNMQGHTGWIVLITLSFLSSLIELFSAAQHSLSVFGVPIQTLLCLLHQWNFTVICWVLLIWFHRNYQCQTDIFRKNKRLIVNKDECNESSTNVRPMHYDSSLIVDCSTGYNLHSLPWRVFQCFCFFFLADFIILIDDYYFLSNLY